MSGVVHLVDGSGHIVDLTQKQKFVVGGVHQHQQQYYPVDDPLTISALGSYTAAVAQQPQTRGGYGVKNVVTHTSVAAPPPQQAVRYIQNRGGAQQSPSGPAFRNSPPPPAPLHQKAVLSSPVLSALPPPPQQQQHVSRTPSPSQPSFSLVPLGPSSASQDRSLVVEEVMSVNMKLQQQNRSLEDRVRFLEQQVEEYQKELADTQGEHFKVSEQLRALEDVTASNHRYYIAASEQLTAANVKLSDEAYKDQESFVSMFMSLRAAYAESRQTIARQTDQRQIDLAMIQEKHEEVSTLKTELNETAARLAKAERELEEKETLVRRLRSKVASKHHEAAEIRNEVDTATDAMFIANETIELLRDRINELEEERDKWKEQQQRANAAFISMEQNSTHNNNNDDAHESEHNMNNNRPSDPNATPTIIITDEKNNDTAVVNDYGNLSYGASQESKLRQQLGQSAFRKGLLEGGNNLNMNLSAY